MKELSLLAGFLDTRQIKDISSYWEMHDSFDEQHIVRAYCRIVELHVAALCNDRLIVEDNSTSIVFNSSVLKPGCYYERIYLLKRKSR